jgi:Na+/H+-translocating membrane pyrophosphatase
MEGSEREGEGSERDLRAEAERDLERLQEGPRVSAGSAGLPVRSLTAVIVFVLVYALVLLLCLLLFGPVGIAIGFFVGAVVGALAVRGYAGLGGRG